MESSFKNLYCNHFNRIKNFANTYLKNEEVAISVTQEVFAHIYENRSNYALDETVVPYLFVMAKNKSLNILKKEKAKQRYCNDKIYQFNIDLNIGALERHPIDKIDYSQLNRTYHETLASMPEPVRETFLLSRDQNLKYREIAEKQNISVKTVEHRIMQALKILKIALKDYYAIILCIFSLW